MRTQTKIFATAAVLGLVAVGVAAGTASAWGPSPWDGYGPRKGFHMMKGGPGGSGRAGMACSGAAQEKVSRMLDGIARQVDLTENQQAKLSAAQEAVRSSRDAVKDTCARVDFSKVPETYTERLDRMEVGLTAALESLQASKPAISAFLQTLTPEQQAELDQKRGCWRR